MLKCHIISIKYLVSTFYFHLYFDLLRQVKMFRKAFQMNILINVKIFHLCVCFDNDSTSVVVVVVAFSLFFLVLLTRIRYVWWYFMAAQV